MHNLLVQQDWRNYSSSWNVNVCLFFNIHLNWYTKVWREPLALLPYTCVMHWMGNAPIGFFARTVNSQLTVLSGEVRSLQEVKAHHYRCALQFYSLVPLHVLCLCFQTSSDRLISRPWCHDVPTAVDHPSWNCNGVPSSLRLLARVSYRQQESNQDTLLQT